MRTIVDMSPVMMSEPAAEQWIQIMKCGEWPYPTPGDPNGKIKITSNDLTLFKENFDNKVRGMDLAVDVSHNPDAGAVAWFKELDVRGDQLWALVGFTEEGAQLVKSGKYRYFSPEFMLQWKDKDTGKVYRDVLFGGALTNRPFLAKMQPIEFSDDELGIVWFSENESSGGTYDPDGDGDNDSTTNPTSNPDWMQDVLAGITKWPTDPKQQKQLADVGATKEAADAAFKIRQDQLKQVKMSETEFQNVLLGIALSEDGVTNAHKTPPKGKPQDASQYADSKNYKYPIDAKHISAAVGYYNQDGQQKAGGYSSDEWDSIGRKIAAAANKLIGPGHSFADGKIATPSNKQAKMDDGTSNLTPSDGDTTPHYIDDEETGKFSETHTNSKRGGANMPGEDQTVSLSEHEALKQRLALVEKENRQAKMSETVSGFLQAGKVVPAQRDKLVTFMSELSDEQVTQFTEIMKEQPKVVEFKEFGAAGGSSEGNTSGEDPQVLLSERTTKIAKEEGISFSEAAGKAYKQLTDEGVKIPIHGQPVQGDDE